MNIFLYLSLYLIAGLIFVFLCACFVDLDHDETAWLLALFWPIWLVIISCWVLVFLAIELAKRLRR